MSLLNFYKESKEALGDSKNYCVIVYKTVGPLNKEIGFIYKDLDEFKNKATDDIKKIPGMYGIKFQIWMYD